jgi:hypothetical protein
VLFSFVIQDNNFSLVGALITFVNVLIYPDQQVGNNQTGVGYLTLQSSIRLIVF